MIKNISSAQNPLIKQMVVLQEKSRERKKTGTFVIEGLREIMLAIEGGYEIEKLLFCMDLLSEEALESLLEKLKNTEVISLSKEVYEKAAQRKTTEGALAIARSKDLVMGNLELGDNPLILVAEASEKPGNIGALLRTADAAALDAVLIANPKTDLYNPNIIRSSVGCIFTNRLATGNSEDIISFLKERNIQILTAALRDDSTAYDQVDFTGPSAIVVGTEDTGLSEIWLKNADGHIIIPMQGKIDSLNVSVSAAILIFEAKRQRNKV